MADEVKELLEETHKLLDYVQCMEMATGYKTKERPNFLYIAKLIQKLKRKGDNFEF